MMTIITDFGTDSVSSSHLEYPRVNFRQIKKFFMCQIQNLWNIFFSEDEDKILLLDDTRDFLRYSDECKIIDVSPTQSILRDTQKISLQSYLICLLIKIAVRCVEIPRTFVEKIIDKLNQDQDILCWILDNLQNFYPEISAFIGLYGGKMKLHKNIILLGFSPSVENKCFQGFYKPKPHQNFNPDQEKKGEKFSQYFFGVMKDEFYSPQILQEFYAGEEEKPRTSDQIILQMMNNLKILAPTLDSVRISPSSMYF